MAQEQKQLKSPKPWEKLGAFFGYFAVAKDSPSILRTLCIPKIAPHVLKRFLLRINPSADFWLLLTFTGLTALILLWWLWRESPTEVAAPAGAEWLQKTIKVSDKDYLLRVIRSFGFVWIRGKILDWRGVRLYGTFRRPPPPHWPAMEGRADQVDRIIFTDGTGMEVQYANDFTRIFIKRVASGSSTFGSTEERPPSWAEIKLLLIASNYFPYWWLMYFVRLPFAGPGQA